jgi:small subunit ribosomal protein S16
MAVCIRLQRIGKPHQAYYRLVAVEKTRGPQGKPIEIIGSYDPRGAKMKDKLVLRKERLDYWVQKGARMSETVESLVKSLEKADKAEASGAAK